MTLEFRGGTSTRRRHIATMGGLHWEIYKRHCVKLGIVPVPAATPKEHRLDQDAKFQEDE